MNHWYRYNISMVRTYFVSSYTCLYGLHVYMCRVLPSAKKQQNDCCWVLLWDNKWTAQDTGEILDEQRMHVLFFTEQHSTHQNENVSRAGCHSNEPNQYTKYKNVKQVFYWRDAVTSWIASCYRRRKSAHVERTKFTIFKNQKNINVQIRAKIFSINSRWSTLI